MLTHLHTLSPSPQCVHENFQLLHVFVILQKHVKLAKNASFTCFCKNTKTCQTCQYFASFTFFYKISPLPSHILSFLKWWWKPTFFVLLVSSGHIIIHDLFGLLPAHRAERHRPSPCIHGQCSSKGLPGHPLLCLSQHIPAPAALAQTDDGLSRLLAHHPYKFL